MYLGLICASYHEANSLLSLSDYIKHDKAGFTFYTQNLRANKIVVAISDIGLINAAACTALLLADYQPDFIVNFGTTGAINTNLHCGDLILPYKIFRQRIAEEIRWQPHSILQATLESILLTHKFPVCHCSLVSQLSFMTTFEEREQLEDAVDIVDMEAAAIVEICQRSQLPVLLCKLLVNEAKERFASMEDYLQYEQNFFNHRDDSLRIMFQDFLSQMEKLCPRVKL